VLPIVRIEGVRGSNPLSSTAGQKVFSGGSKIRKGPRRGPTDRRPGRSEGTAYFEHRDEARHRSCKGVWRGELTAGAFRRRVSGKTRTEVLAKLRDLREELGSGIRSSASYTVQQCVDDWIASLNLSPKTVQTQRELLAPVVKILAKQELRNLTPDECG
jgi:hypothetical protein